MYSVVVPIYNESHVVRELHLRIVSVMRKLEQPFEIVFVNDGSTDDTMQQLSDLQPLTVITFRRNFGQSAALDAGIKQAKGDYIITLDGDLQNPPEEIPKLIAAMQDQAVDVVSGWRKARQDAMSKRLISRGANILRKFFVDDGIHDSGCTLKLYKKECFEQLDLFGEMHRLIPGVLKWQGFLIGEIEVDHAPRTSGKSKYGSARILKGFVDMVGVWFWRQYSSRPLHLFGGGGMLLTGIGSVLLIILAIARLGFDYSLSNRIWPTIAVLFILVGIQLFISGLLGEILVKQYYRDGRRSYSIRSITQQ